MRSFRLTLQLSPPASRLHDIRVAEHGFAPLNNMPPLLSSDDLPEGAGVSFRLTFDCSEGFRLSRRRSNAFRDQIACSTATHIRACHEIDSHRTISHDPCEPHAVDLNVRVHDLLLHMRTAYVRPITCPKRHSSSCVSNERMSAFSKRPAWPSSC